MADGVRLPRRLIGSLLVCAIVFGMVLALRTMPYMVESSSMRHAGVPITVTATVTTTATATVTAASMTVTTQACTTAAPAAAAADASGLLSKYMLLPLDPTQPMTVLVDYEHGPAARRERFPSHDFRASVRIAYPPFAIRLPYFVDDEVRRAYYEHSYIQERARATEAYCGTDAASSPIGSALCARRHRDELIYADHAHIEGTLDIIRNVSFRSHECGWMASPDKVQPLEHGQQPEFDRLASLDVPEGCTFQHFMDGVLPKIVQAWPLLQDPSVKIMTPACSNWPMVNSLYAHIGIDAARLVSVRPTSAREYYSLCDTPGWHPILWTEMKRMLRSDESVPVVQRRKIVYLQRNANARNGGRRISNEAELIEVLKHQTRTRGLADGQSVELELVVFDSSQLPTVADNIAFFRDAAVIIGPHGGAFYNMMYCPRGTVVVEFLPRRTVFFLFAQMSSMLGHEHWYLPMGDAEANVMDVGLVGRLLDQALRSGPALP